MKVWGLTLFVHLDHSPLGVLCIMRSSTLSSNFVVVSAGPLLPSSPYYSSIGVRRIRVLPVVKPCCTGVGLRTNFFPSPSVFATRWPSYQSSSLLSDLAVVHTPLPSSLFLTKRPSQGFLLLYRCTHWPSFSILTTKLSIRHLSWGSSLLSVVKAWCGLWGRFSSSILISILTTRNRAFVRGVPIKSTKTLVSCDVSSAPPLPKKQTKPALFRG